MKTQPSEEPWLQPKEFVEPHFSRAGCVDEWKVWDDPHPFHVAQGYVENCGLIAALMAIAQKKELIEQIIPRRDYTITSYLYFPRTICINFTKNNAIITYPNMVSD